MLVHLPSDGVAGPTLPRVVAKRARPLASSSLAGGA
jgi:hypothetical protein